MKFPLEWPEEEFQGMADAVRVTSTYSIIEADRLHYVVLLPVTALACSILVHLLENKINLPCSSASR